MPCSLSPEQIAFARRFHGHWCPGLAIGIRAAEWALLELGYDNDESIVAVTETDMCGVDGIQALVGCTFGKGNLLFKDMGKMAFSFYRRSDGKAARLLLKSEADGPKAAGREEHAQWLMDAELLDLFEVQAARWTLPPKAHRLASLLCSACGESTMETRTRRMHDQVLCLECFEAREARI